MVLARTTREHSETRISLSLWNSFITSWSLWMRSRIFQTSLFPYLSLGSPLKQFLVMSVTWNKLKMDLDTFQVTSSSEKSYAKKSSLKGLTLKTLWKKMSYWDWIWIRYCNKWPGSCGEKPVSESINLSISKAKSYTTVAIIYHSLVITQSQLRWK